MLYQAEVNMLSKEEKLLLLDVLLQDFCGNWGASDTRKRYPLVVQLCEELVAHYPIQEVQKNVLKFPESDFYGDGYFEFLYQKGGYEGLQELHQLPVTFLDKKHEFKVVASEYITTSYLFEDIEEDDAIILFDHYNVK